MSVPEHPYMYAITAELKRAGIDSFEFKHGGKHPRVVYTHEGKQFMYVIPSSPSDSLRGIKNAISGIRRQIGIRAPERSKSTRPAKTKSRPSIIAMPDTFTIADNPLMALARWKPPSRFLWVRTGGRTWRVEMVRAQ